MGRDLIQCRADIALTISIHAPAWGATARPAAVLIAECISIHAPAWGATLTSVCRSVS